MLSLLLSRWRLIAYAIVAIASIGVFFYLRHRLGLVAELEIALRQEREINAANIAEIYSIKQTYIKQIDALDRERRAAAEASEKIENIRKGLINAEDAPVAPVLRAVLDGLRKPYNAN